METDYQCNMLDVRSMLRIALTIVVTSAIAPRVATAHFVLHAPASWREQGSLGDPQKTGPCGDEANAAAPTGIVTAFSPGETITITIDEAIYHPGHYRVALAVHDRSELPAEPAVTPSQYTECGTADVMRPPVFPILADGVLPHTQPFDDLQSFTVTLPSDVTCDHCTLQVIEFMSSHGSPCFYHHCADISIKAGGGGDGCQSDAECDDGDACTHDACTGAQGCASTPMTLADVTAGFLGTLQASACSDQQIPKAPGALFTKAGALVARGVQNPTRAARLLRKATKKLDAASKKVAKSSPRKISAGCATALRGVVDQAIGRVACVLSTL